MFNRHKISGNWLYKRGAYQVRSFFAFIPKVLEMMGEQAFFIDKFMVGIQKGAVQSYRVEFKEINGEPGMIFWVEERVSNVWSFHIEEEKIKSIYIVLNPDKLRHIEVTK